MAPNTSVFSFSVRSKLYSPVKSLALAELVILIGLVTQPLVVSHDDPDFAYKIMFFPCDVIFRFNLVFSYGPQANSMCF